MQFTVLEKDGELEDRPWTLAVDFRAGVLRLDWGRESNNVGVTSFRKQ